MRCIRMAATLILLSTAASGQEQAPAIGGETEFVRYPQQLRSYLRRLHGRVSKLHWREDLHDGFPAWQATAKSKLQDLLGLPQIDADCRGHEPETSLSEPSEDTHGVVRRLGKITTEPGITIPFWLLSPSHLRGEKRPLILCAHGHDKDGWNSYAGVYEDVEHQTSVLAKDGDVGVQAVRRGYIALVPATRGLAKATEIPDLRKRHGDRPCRAQLMHCLLAGRTAIGERVWDTRKLLDWAMAELPDVDPERVVMLGNSGGGVLTVYAAALDDRIRVAVPSCSFSSYTSNSGFIFHCDCCLVPRMQTELGDFADIGGLVAPRALLSVHGRKDRLHNYRDVEAAMARVSQIYTAANANSQFQHRWGADGHKFYPKIMWPFIAAHLQ